MSLSASVAVTARPTSVPAALFSTTLRSVLAPSLKTGAVPTVTVTAAEQLFAVSDSYVTASTQAP